MSRYFSAVVVLCALAWGVCQAELSAQAVMAPDEIKPGMKGYGLTVFKGGDVERFDVEVIGVLKNMFPRGDIILVRLKHPAVEKAGVIAGMSGSPLYIDDKLIGAVAYGWSFLKEPIAGVQPITQMMETLKIEGAANAVNKEQAAGSLRNARELASLLLEQYYGKGSVDENALLVQAREVLLPRRNFDAAGGQLRPLPCPLYVSGCGSELDLARRMLPDMEILPMNGSAGGREGQTGQPAKLVKIDLKPGMALGLSLISGDIDMTAMGTLTYVEGDRILAFGHPMMNAGKVKLPMVAGRILDVIPSINRSFKMGVNDGVVGTIMEDRDSAIAGRVGVAPPMIPLKFTLDGAVKRQYNVNVAVDKRLTPLLMAAAGRMMTGYLQGAEFEKTFKSTVRIFVKDRDKPLEMQNLYGSSAEMLMADVMLPISALMDNPFKELEVSGVDVALEVIPEDRAAQIISVSTNAFYVTREQEVEVTAVLRPRKAGGNVVQKISFKVPNDVQPGSQMKLVVCGGNQSHAIDLALKPGLTNPRNIEQLIELVSRSEPSTNLVLRLGVVKQGVSYNGEMMPALPPSVASVLVNSSQTGLVEPLIDDVVLRQPTSWVVIGAQATALQVVQ